MKTNRPVISKKMIDHLENLVPPKDFKPGDNMDDVMFHAGRRDIIKMLRGWYDSQK